MKICADCKQEKPDEQFGSDKSRHDGRSVRCKPCNVKRSTGWAKNNKERRKAISEKYRIANAEKCKASVKKSQEKNQARISKWVEENKEKIKEYKKKWRENNKEYHRSSKAKRRGAAGKYTREDIERLYALQFGKCACCRSAMKKDFHRDHITPIARGGTNEASNIQLLCPECNRKKGAKDPLEFMQQLGYLL